MSETPAVEPQDSSTIREMRAQLEAHKNDLNNLRTENQALSEKLTSAEREKMTEIERLTAERDDFKKNVGDLTQYRSQAEKAAAFAQAQYEKKLQSVPDEYRETVAGLAKFGDPFDRLEALESALGLIKIPATKAGTTTDPGATTPAVTPATMGSKETPPDQKKDFNPKTSLSDAIAQKRAG